MIVLWITVLFLHQGYSLVPVKTVQFGESVTLSCDLSNEKLGSRIISWYKQSAGDGLKLIVTQSKAATTKYGPEFSRTRFDAQNDENFSSLTILKAVQEDEGFYHCGVAEWMFSIQWSGTYLLVKGKTQVTSNYTVVQWPTVTDSLHPGDTTTLQCSVLTDSNKTCPGDLSVLWFRAGSKKSHPNIIYTDAKRHDECERRSEPQQRCAFHFSKKIGSSDAGTYYCAVATCGEILFGNGTTVELAQSAQPAFIQMLILKVCLAVSIIGNVFLICNRRICKLFQGTDSSLSETHTGQLHKHTTEADDQLNYAALSFSERKTRGRRKREFAEDSVYSQVKC